MSTTIAHHHRLAKWAGIFLLSGVPLAYAQDGYDIVLYVKLLISQIGALLMIMAWLMGSIRANLPNQRYPLDVPLLLFLLIHILSWATQSINPFNGGFEVVKVSTFVTLYFACSRTFHLSNLQPWIYTTTITATFVSIIGICQYMGIEFLWLRSSGYPSATFVYRNFAAMYLIMVIPIAFIPYMQAKHLYAEIFWGIAIGAQIIFLIYTRTRGAWIGFLGSLLLVLCAWWFLRKHTQSTPLILFTKRKYILSLVILLITIYCALIPTQIPVIYKSATGMPSNKIQIDSTVQSIIAKQDNGRSIMWTQTLEMIHDYSIFGVGLGNWHLIYPIYERGATFPHGFVARRPHNDLLWIWSEMGILGLFTLLYIFFTIIKKNLCLFQNPPSQTPSYVILSLAISLFAIIGHSQFSFPKERISPVLLCSLILGILSALPPQQTITYAVSKKQIFPVILSILCLLFGMVFTFRAIKADKLYYSLILHQQRSDWSEVIRIADRALQYGVIDHKILFWKAFAFHRQGNTTEALTTYKTCLTYHPNDMITHWKIGILEQLEGHLEKAQTSLEKAVFLDINNAGYHQDLGTIYQLQGNLQSAYASYAKALSLGEENPTIYLNLGHIYEIWEQHKKAIETYEKILNTWQDEKSIREQAQIRLQKLQ